MPRLARSARLPGLLLPFDDLVVVVQGEDAEAVRLADRDALDGDRHVGALTPVLLHERLVVHLVDVVARQDDHILGPFFLQRVDVLIDRVGRALIPLFVDPLLRRHDVDAFAQLRRQARCQPRLIWRSRLIALYCVSTSILRRPLFRQLDSVKSMMR